MWFVENYNDRASLGIKTKQKLVEQQTSFQKITIYNTDFFGKLLTLDDMVMLSEKDEFVYHEMIVHMPLCAHPNPQKVLVVGGGDGGSIREVLKHDNVQEAVLCEIDEQVVRLCQQYMPTVAGKLTNPRVKLVFQDGFKFLQNYENYFDLIVTDSTDPIGPGVALFQEDYYRLVKKALKPDGMMTCQSETPWFYADIMRDMTQNLCNVFQHVQTYIAMVPLYPSGMWTITFAADQLTLNNFDLAKSQKISKTCKYYNPEIHQAALALPNFARQVVHNT